MLDGKQIKDGTISAIKLASALLSSLLRADGSVPWAGAQDANNNRLTNLAAPVNSNDAARLADVHVLPWKDSVKAAATANVATLSGDMTLDGVSVTTGDRVLLPVQTTGSQNGIYIVGTPWARASDADSTAELRGAVVYVEQGTANGSKRFAQTVEAPVVDTDALVWVNIGSTGPGAAQTSADKGLAALQTTADGQAAIATGISGTPAGDGYVRVSVNGIGVRVGNGTKVAPAYFSGDAGVTARAFGAIAQSDTLHWNGGQAGFELAVTDVVDLEYDVMA